VSLARVENATYADLKRLRGLYDDRQNTPPELRGFLPWVLDSDMEPDPATPGILCIVDNPPPDPIEQIAYGHLTGTDDDWWVPVTFGTRAEIAAEVP
jgi:hypothetical protein